MNFLIKKNVFEELGGFNNEYWPGEDSKLCEDLVYKNEGKIFYHPEVCVYHHRRDNLKGFLKQHANYGYHRGAFFAHGDKNSRRLSYIIPTFLFYICAPFLFLKFIFKFQISNFKFFPSFLSFSTFSSLSFFYLNLSLLSQSFFSLTSLMVQCLSKDL